jgi:hypothetical protein
LIDFFRGFGRSRIKLVSETPAAAAYQRSCFCFDNKESVIFDELPIGNTDELTTSVDLLFGIMPQS